MLSPSRVRLWLWRLRLRLSLVLSDGGAVVVSMVCQVDWAVGLRMGLWIGTCGDAVLSLSIICSVVTVH